MVYGVLPDWSDVIIVYRQKVSVGINCGLLFILLMGLGLKQRVACCGCRFMLPSDDWCAMDPGGGFLISFMKVVLGGMLL